MLDLIQKFELIKKFERVLTTALVLMMAVVVVLSVADLARELVKDVVSPPPFLLDSEELLDLFGAFLLVLIGIELLESVKAYVDEHAIRAEIIVLVALIALARKIIVLDVKSVSSATLLGVASLLGALGLTYHFIRKTREDQHDVRST